MALPAIHLGRRAGDQPAPPKTGQNSAEVAGIETEISAQLGGGGMVAKRELVEDARLGQRKRAVQQPLAENADLLRVEAVEAPHRGDAVLQRSRAHGASAQWRSQRQLFN